MSGPAGPEPAGVAEALEGVRRRIAGAGGDLDRIRIVAVTKGHGPEAVRAAARAGLADIGENYAQELTAKVAALGPEAAGLRWHFLGSIQRRKVPALAPLVELWHGVDRPEEAAAIGSARPGAAVLVEVALGEGEGRAGCRPGDLDDLVASLPPTVRLAGLMAVGPPGPPEAARPGFRWLADQARRLGLAEVSMGMTGDLEVAVQEGATMVRVGTALFGPRPVGPQLGR